MAKLNFHQSWENIFKAYNILDRIAKEGYVTISADEIKAVDGKEPRNLTKIDFREKLPHIMQEHDLSILAVKNGLYKIAKNDPFIDVAKEIQNEIEEIEVPKNLLTIDPFNIKSESGALDIAAISGMLTKVFEEEAKLSIRGRLRGDLDFSLGDTHYNVAGVQIEVDGGYETSSAVHLIEAKIGYTNNINIRQLLYPQLYWEQHLQGKKSLKSYLFYLQGDIFRFIPYIYDGDKGYLEHKRERVFRFKDPQAKFSLYSIKVDQKSVDSSVPFPQADRFETILTMLFLIAQEESVTKEELSMNFDIVERQIDYYLNVLKWLQLAKESKGFFMLTPKGKKIADLAFRQRVEALAKIVFADPICNRLLYNQEVDPKLFAVYNVNSQSTIKRRLRTIRSWIKYFQSILES